MKIVLKKISKDNTKIIQSELLLFIRYKVDNLSNCNDYQQYCNDIIVIDILQSMFYVLRSKIESLRAFSNIGLTPSQAVILLYCCSWNREDRNQEQKNTMQIISDCIHQKLVNL